MSDKPETIDAIVAEMRGRILGEDRIKYTLSADEALAFADRIERAAKNTENAFGMALAIEDGLHKRDKQSAPGNAAAMRAALENARSKFIHIKKCADEGEVSRKKLAILCEFVSQEIAAALTAPPRNCDRPECRTEEGASATYIAEHPHAEEPDASTYGSWLLAPAEERKGENK